MLFEFHIAGSGPSVMFQWFIQFLFFAVAAQGRVCHAHLKQRNMDIEKNLSFLFKYVN